MEQKELILKIKDTLSDAKFSSGGEIFLSGSGRFANARGEYMTNFEVLLKIEKLRQAVNSAHDFVTLLDT